MGSRKIGRRTYVVYCLIAALLVTCGMVPAFGADANLRLSHVFDIGAGLNSYHYILTVSDQSILVPGESTLELRGMDGVLTQGAGSFWRNAGVTETSAKWVYVGTTDATTLAGEASFQYFDITADAKKTKPGLIDYEVSAKIGSIGSVEGPVAKDPPPLYDVSGTVYLDGDGSGGLYEPPGDSILRGVTVALVAADGTVVQTTVSNGGINQVDEGYIGNYLFSGVSPGDYTVVVPDTVVIAGQTLLPTTDTVASITVIDASVRQVDFGYMPEPTYSISGTTFIDANNNGSFDAGEERLGGVVLQLLNAEGTMVAQTESGGVIEGPDGSYLGNYIFEGLPAGSYTVKAPTGVGSLEITTPDTREVEIVDANVAGIDFGYLDPDDYDPGDDVAVEVIAVVFFDANQNGKFDDGEIGLELVGITLSGDSFQVLSTDGDGFALFGEHGEGDYSIGVTDGGPQKLFKYWEATTPISYDFTIDGDTEGPLVFKFGVYPDKPQIIDAINRGDIFGNNKTIGFWMHNISFAIQDRTRGIQVSRGDLLKWLAEVEELFFEDPYDFGADKLQKAFWYLHPAQSGNEPTARLARQLLAAELNWVSGFNSSEPGLEELMLWWAEWVYNYQPEIAGEIAEFIDRWNNLGNAGDGTMAVDGSIGDEDTNRVND